MEPHKGRAKEIRDTGVLEDMQSDHYFPKSPHYILALKERLVEEIGKAEVSDGLRDILQTIVRLL